MLKTRELARRLEAFIWSKEESKSYLLSRHYLKQLQQLFASNLAAELILIPRSTKITIGNMATFKTQRHLETLSSLWCEGQNYWHAPCYGGGRTHWYVVILGYHKTQLHTNIFQVSNLSSVISWCFPPLEFKEQCVKMAICHCRGFLNHACPYIGVLPLKLALGYCSPARWLGLQKARSAEAGCVYSELLCTAINYFASLL